MNAREKALSTQGILFEIFSQLDPKSLANVAQVSKSFNQQANNQVLWKKMFSEDYPEIFAILESEFATTKKEIDWKGCIRYLSNKKYANLSTRIEALYFYIWIGSLAGLKSLKINFKELISFPKTLFSNTPLNMAIKLKNQSIFDYLYESVIKKKKEENIDETNYLYFDSRNEKYFIPDLSFAAMFNQSSQEIDMLFKQAPMNHYLESFNYYPGHPLYFAARFGHIAVANALFKYKFDKPAFVQEMLITAIKYRQSEFVQFLINKGIWVNAENRLGEKAIRVSREKGYTEIVKMLENEIARQDQFRKIKCIISQADTRKGNETIAGKIANLFDCYAHPSFLLLVNRHKTNMQCADEIATELFKNLDWDFYQCKAYINFTLNHFKGPIEKYGTFAGLLLEIDKLETAIYQNNNNNNNNNSSISFDRKV